MRIVRVLVLLVLFGSLPMAVFAGPIQSGDVVRFSDEPGNTGGGEFKLTDVSNAADWIITFCLQKTEYMNFTSDFFVGSITDHTLTDPGDKGGDINGEDQISTWTAWLYTQFTNQTLANYSYNNTATAQFANRQDSANALQRAIWGFEGEEALDGSNYYVNLAQNNTPQNFGLGDVRVLNLYVYSATGDHKGAEAQDQLTRVPEPSTMALMGVGLFSLCVRRRQRV